MSEHLNYGEKDFDNLANFFVREAEKRGASYSEISIDETNGINLTCMDGELESVSHENPTNVRVQIYDGDRSISSLVQDLSESAIVKMLDATMPMLSHVAQEEGKGPVDPEYSPKKIITFDRYHPWYPEVGDALDLIVKMEKAGREGDPRIVKTTECSVDFDVSHTLKLSSRGVRLYEKVSSQSLYCGLMAKDGEEQENGYHYDYDCEFSRLEKPEEIGAEAAKRTASKLGAKPIATGEYPVIFSREVSPGLFGSFFRAIMGSRLYYKSTFLLDALGKQVFPNWLTITEDPHIKGRFSSRVMDSSGVATKKNVIVEKGVLAMNLYSLYYARKLGQIPTGHENGVTNIDVTHTHADLESLIKEMGTGILVTSMQGSSINLITGTYSRAMEGFWVENGVIGHRLNEITLGGNLKDMYMGIKGIANDSLRRQDMKIGSVWIDKMVVGSNS